MAKKPKQVKITRATKSVTTRKSKATRPATKDSSDPARRFVVRGTVSYPDKSPGVGLLVTAFDQDVAGKDQLGQAVTDEKGYRIEYSEARFRRSRNERRGADVFVRVYGATGDLLFQSKTVVNAPTELQLNV